MNYFFIGIKGTAMSNLAVILKQMGHSVAGTDVEDVFITDPVLKQNGITVYTGFDPAILPLDTECVVYSAAHGGDGNPVAASAGSKGIALKSQAVLLGELLDQFKNRLAVSGCHGKTTTSSLLAYSLSELGMEPSYMVGVPFFNGQPGGGYGSNDYFVIEADEYGVNPPKDKTAKFLHLHPSHILCTNIDYDHPDVYKDIEETKRVFLQFFTGRKLYLCIDDPVLSTLLPKMGKSDMKTYGFSNNADMRIIMPVYREQETLFTLQYRGKNLGQFSVKLFGEKNLLNVAGVVLMLTDLGFAPDSIRQAIREFSSVKRRNELQYTDGSTYVFDDYGHHPSEIAATTAAARKRFPGKRIIMIFQPHTYSRTISLKEAFVDSLRQADYAIIAPIFASAREERQETVTSSILERLAQEKGIRTVVAAGSNQEILDLLRKNYKKGDIIFTAGAGDIYKLKDDIIGIILQLQ